MTIKHTHKKQIYKTKTLGFVLSLIILSVLPSVLIELYQKDIDINIQNYNNQVIENLIQEIENFENLKYKVKNCKINKKNKINFVKQLFLLSANEKLQYKIYHIETKGYKNDLNYLIAFNLNKTNLYQIKILTHNETPGLGDKIEREKHNWINQFNHFNLNNLKVMNFDIISGATISSQSLANSIQFFSSQIDSFTCNNF